MQKIRWFIEDNALWLLPVALVIGLGLGALLFSGDSDCSAEVEAAEVALVGEMLEAIGPELIQMQLQIRSLQEWLAIERAKDGSSGDAGIRQNEELGAWSDPAGEFVCFPAGG